MIAKLLSGRFLLTMISGIVFGYVAIKQIIDGATTAAILTAVFTSYFQRSDRGSDVGTLYEVAEKAKLEKESRPDPKTGTA